MKTIIDAMTLRRGLDAAYRILDRYSVGPSALILLQTKGQGVLEVLATDLVLWGSSDVKAENLVDGAIAADCKKLRDLVSRLKGRIEISYVGEDLAIRAGNATYQLHGRTAEGFPRAPESSGLTFHAVYAETLCEMIDRVSFSVSEDPARPHMNGVLFESDGETARMVSTDGHRLTRVEHPLPGGPVLSAGVIIPRKGVLEIKKAVPHEGKLELATDHEHMYVRGATATLVVKLIAATFPDHAMLLSTIQTRDPILVDRRSLLDAVQRARLVVPTYEGVLLSVTSSSKLSVSGGSSVGLGAFHEDVPVEYRGPDGVIAQFRPSYLVDFLKSSAEDQIQVQVGPGESDPAVLRAGDGHLGVIMPMKF